MVPIPTTLKSTAAGFVPAFGHVSIGNDRHADLLSCIGIIGRVSLDEVFKQAEALGLPKTGPYYNYLTEEFLASLGACYGLVFTVWKDCSKAEDLPDLSISLVQYDCEWEVGTACVIHRAKASHDGKIITYAIDPAASDPKQQIRTDLDALAPAWYIGIHSMNTTSTKK